MVAAWSKYFSPTIFHSRVSPLFLICIRNGIFCQTGSKGFEEVDQWKIKTPQVDLWNFRGWSWWESIVTHETGRTGW